MPSSFTNTTNTSSSNSSSHVSSHSAVHRTNTNTTSWHDSASDLGYGVGQLFRATFDFAWNAYQNWWNPAPSQAETALQKQHKIYRQGLEECAKHLDRALDNLRKNPNDPQSLKRIEKLASHYVAYVQPAPTDALKQVQEKLFGPIEAQLTRLKNKTLENAAHALLPGLPREAFTTPTENAKETELQKRTAEQSSTTTFNTVALPLDNQVQDIVIQNNYAYTVNGAEGLKIIDLSDPNNTTVVSQYDTPGNAQRIVFNNGYVYIADGVGGMQIVNVNNVTNPVFAGVWMTGNPVIDVAVINQKAYIADGTNTLTEVDVSVPEVVLQTIVPTTEALDVAITGNIAYVADWTSGLRVVDVSNKAIPKLLATLPTTGARNVAVSGNIAYVADDISGLRIIDVSNATNPILLATFNTTAAYGVALLNNTAYVADTGSGLRIIDVSNGTNPKLLATLNTTNAINVAISNNTAYVADYYSGLLVIDVSNAINPALFGTLPMAQAVGVAILGNTAYVANSQAYLRVVDVSNAMNPTLLAAFPTTDTRDVAVLGNIGYVADAGSGLRVVDVSNKTNPVLLGTFPMKAIGVAVSGNIAFVADYTSGLRIIQVNPLISVNTYVFRNNILQLSSANNYLWVMQSGGFQPFDPAIPILSSSFAIQNTRDISIVNNLAYVAASNLGLQIIDVSNAVDLKLLGNVSTTQAQDIVVSGDFAYVADYYSGLRIIDVSNSTNPKLIGNISTPNAEGVAVSGTIVYVVDYISGLLVINASNATNPELLGNVSMLNAWNIVVVGKVAYIADSDSGLRIIDVSNVTNPILVGSVNVTYAFDIAASGNFVYVADPASGLQIIDISNGTNPKLLSTFPTTDASGVAVSDNTTYAYVADYTSGLRVVNVSNATNPTLIYQFDILGRAEKVAVSGNIVCIGSITTGLTILNMTSLPWLPFYGLSPFPQTMQIAYPYAMIANTNMLGIWNITNASQIQYLGGWNSSVVINHIEVMKNQLFLGQAGGITVLNMTNPTLPQFVNHYLCTQPVQSFVINNGTLYLPGTYQCHEVSLTFCPLNEPLTLGNHDIQIHKGQNLRLTPNDLSASCGNSTTPNLGTAFTVTGITHAQVQTRNSSGFWNNASSFLGSDLSQGNVELIQDNTTIAPEINFTVTDGETTLSAAADVQFSTTESTVNVTNIMVLIQSNGTTILNPQQFQITDSGTKLDNVVISVISVQDGYFSLVNTSTPISDFTYYQLQNGQIQFVQNGTGLPKITLSIGDGSSEPVLLSPLVSFFNTDNPSVPLATVVGGVVGTTVFAAAAGMAAFGIFKYRQNQERKEKQAHTAPELSAVANPLQRTPTTS